ncbi:P-loop containing nucleoside triphosphate hydrolase protein [Coniophora puteana RWD-64-598 SS2]|uniref:DNA helicase n=1 Tax=Coniophora puteana (strain RWD-64-598) TaxID=741705 RepID=A0A5M3MLG6_CONPW|nr:P-loop containing nucleoside triphosphate hydrolase protein [Coniophora puteana RWD-64-598 SS2]EIW79810.1 P-loop containing nucleoside triphosphate hydrolase protein [Coniophora puteana RWD-64-598 SS2]
MSSSHEPTTDAQLHAFIDRQRALLQLERDAEIERSSLLLTNCSPKLLEQRGLALGALGTASVGVGLGGKTLVELERPSAWHTDAVFPPHSFRPGDIARIEENAAGSGGKKAPKGKKTGAGGGTGGGEKSMKAIEGVVYKVTDTRIVIALDPSETSSEDAEIPECARVVKLANSVTYDRMDKTIDQLEKTGLPSTRKADDKSSYPLTALTRVLLGISPRSEPSSPARVEEIQFYDPSLNASQKEAVRFALSAGEVACIHGPPGTGKTHTLIEIIRQLASPPSSSTSLTSTGTPSNPNQDQEKKPKRILVCGASNLAVDNILERLLALPAPTSSAAAPAKLTATRIGHPARVMAHEGVLEATLEVRAGRSDQAALAKDVKAELEATLDVLSGKGKGGAKARPRGAERRKMWDEVKALRKEYRQREGGVVRAVLGESQIVLATCHSAGGRQLRNHSFDVVIIDEATQAMEAVCWVPIFKAQKLILAGDPMQLPPTILSTDKSKVSKKAKDGKVADRKAKRRPGLRPPRSLETTLFDRLERMYGPGIKRLLNVQYRMHAQICAFPSATLYASRLKSAESVSAHLLSDLPGTRAWQAASDAESIKEVLGTPIVFFDTAGCEFYERLEGSGDNDTKGGGGAEEGSKCNENEAGVVKRWVERLVEAGVLPSQIAVITPYQAQVTLLTSLLRETYGPELEIGTVDGMQGREKEAVVISLVRSNEKREVGFLKEKRRLNVAMTRAKRHLCVVGDSDTVQHGGPYLKKWLTWLEANADVRFAELE